MNTGFKQGSGNKTPPPAYTPTAADPSTLSSGSGAAAFDSYNPYNPSSSVTHNPWASVPTATHPHPSSGPTPASALQIPYAYYDPRSEHSLAEADTRARQRFWSTLFWVFMAWILVALIVNWDRLPTLPHTWHDHGNY